MSPSGPTIGDDVLSVRIDARNPLAGSTMWRTAIGARVVLLSSIRSDVFVVVTGIYSLLPSLLSAGAAFSAGRASPSVGTPARLAAVVNVALPSAPMRAIPEVNVVPSG